MASLQLFGTRYDMVLSFSEITFEIGCHIVISQASAIIEVCVSELNIHDTTRISLGHYLGAKSKRWHLLWDLLRPLLHLERRFMGSY